MKRESSSGSFDYGPIAGSGIAKAFYIGGRYYFTDNLAGMIELGYGIAYLNIGIALKFLITNTKRRLRSFGTQPSFFQNL